MELRALMLGSAPVWTPMSAVRDPGAGAEFFLLRPVTERDPAAELGPGCGDVSLMEPASEEPGPGEERGDLTGLGAALLGGSPLRAEEKAGGAMAAAAPGAP